MAGVFRPEPNARAVIEPEAATPRLLLRHLQPLAAPDAFDPLPVHLPTGIAQQSRDPAIAVATILASQGNDVFGKRRFVIGPARHLALRRSVLSEHPAYASFRHGQDATDMIDAAPPPRRA